MTSQVSQNVTSANRSTAGRYYVFASRLLLHLAFYGQLPLNTRLSNMIFHINAILGFLILFFFFFLPQLDSNYISVAPFFDGWNTRQCSRPSRMWRHTAPPRLLLSSYGAATVAAADRGKVAPFRGNYQPKMVEINCVTLDETEITTLSAMMTFIGGRKLMVRRTGEVGAPGPGAGRPIYHGSGPRLRDK